MQNNDIHEEMSRLTDQELWFMWFDIIDTLGIESKSLPAKSVAAWSTCAQQSWDHPMSKEHREKMLEPLPELLLKYPMLTPYGSWWYGLEAEF